MKKTKSGENQIIVPVALAYLFTILFLAGCAQDPTISVNISVYDASGNPADGAFVSAYSDYELGSGAADKWTQLNGSIQATGTAKNGYVTLQIIPGNYAFKASLGEQSGGEEKLIIAQNNSSISIYMSRPKPGPAPGKNTCVPAGGTCRNSCAANESASTTLTCGSPTTVCCIPQTQGPAPKTITLYDQKEYPYDSTKTSGTKRYTTIITTASNNPNALYSIEIRNSAEQWTSPSTDGYELGPLYPTDWTQSLSGHKPATATFGQGWADGTLGKGYATVEFTGFENKNTRSVIEIGNKVTGLPMGTNGGVAYRADNDAQRNIPFYISLSGTNSGSSFDFEGKTVWYSMRFGSGGKAIANDYNISVSNGDYINGHQWTIENDGTTTYVRIDGGERWQVGIMANFSFDNLTVRIENILPGNKLVISADTILELRLNSESGTLLYNTRGDSTDASYGLLLLSNNKPTLTNTIEKLIPLYTTDSTRPVYYTPMYNPVTNKLFLLLYAQKFGAGASNKIKDGKEIAFLGTNIPADDGVYTEYDTYPNNSYYVPKNSDFSSGTQNNGLFTSSNAYFIATFVADDKISDGNITVYIDTSNGGNIGPFGGAGGTGLSGYSYDVRFRGKNSWNLQSGTDSSYLKAAYTDAGTKVWLLDNDGGVMINSPQQREKVNIVIMGQNVIKSVSNGVVTYGEGAKTYNVNLNSGSAAGDVEVLTAMDSSDTNALTNAQLSYLFNKTITEKAGSNIQSLAVREMISVDVDAKFDASNTSIKDLVAKINSGKFSYKVAFGSSAAGLDLGSTSFVAGPNDDITIVFFGEQYKLVSAQLSRNGTKSVVLEKK